MVSPNLGLKGDAITVVYSSAAVEITRDSQGHIAPLYKDDAEYMRRYLQKYPDHVEKTSARLLSDVPFVRSLIELGVPACTQHLKDHHEYRSLRLMQCVLKENDDLADDKEFVLQIICLDFLNYSVVSPRLKRDPDVYRLAMLRDSTSALYIPDAVYNTKAFQNEFAPQIAEFRNNGNIRRSVI